MGPPRPSRHAGLNGHGARVGAMTGLGPDTLWGWVRPASLSQLCDSGQMIRLSEPQLPHLYNGEATGYQ